ncbi:ATP-binding protein [Streptomyces sp. RLB3-6]|nr:ATP-binding protein [Streptomyces sp. RLB3-6]
MRGRAGGLVRIGEPGDAGDTGRATAGRASVGTVEEDSARRTLLTVAVRDYGDGDAEFTAGIDEQLSVVADWWCAPGAPEPFTHVPAPELRERYDVERFLHESEVRETPGRALVVFITGHGQLGASRTHFLQLPRTEPRRQLATAIRTSEIVAAALDSRAEHVLVVINTCYAAGIAEELEKLHQEILPSRRTGGSLDVVATCAHDQLVQVRQFPSVMRRVLERLRTTAQITTPWLSVAHLMTEFESELGTDTERRKHRLKRVLDGGGQTALTPCLPNPGYRPVRELVGPARRQVATPADEVDHWLDRASGRPQETDPGWYFSGREGLGRAVTAFLGRPRGVLLLTGTAGSGKSAVLARAVTLSDPLFRDDPRHGRALRSAAPETVPPEGSVTAAVLARHRTASDVLGDLLRALELPPRPAGPTDDPVELRRAQLLAHLDEPGDPVTLVLDGLDESVEPFRVVRDVLAPLTAHCGAAPSLPGQRRPERQRSLRLLIGVRSSRPRADRAAPPGPAGRAAGLLGALREVFPTASVLRTDETDSESDIADYVQALVGAETPGGDSTRQAAETVAKRVWPSFLDARLAGEQLHHASDPDALAGNPDWLDLLQAGTIGLLRRDLALVEDEGLPAEVALALLRAAAFALGAGIPWSDVWPAVAGALLGRPVEEPDRMIENLLKSRLAGYLAHDDEDDRLVYRPAHEALAELLRDPRQDLLAGVGGDAV